MLLTFMFAANPDTNEIAFSGNQTPQQALQIIQNIVISMAVKEAQDKVAQDKARDNGQELAEVPAKGNE